MTRPCPACGDNRWKLLGRAGDRLFHTTQKLFELRECLDCELVYLHPCPDERELAQYYPAGYWWQTTNAAPRRSFWRGLMETYRAAMVRGQVRRVRRLLADKAGGGGRFLDLGCGDGLFLNACRDLPAARVGLDPSLHALRSARAQVGVEVAQGTSNALPFRSETFRVISLFHVLEHLPDPRMCLAELHRVLEPGGWLVVQVPNAASLQRRLLGLHWEGFDVPRHLANYNPRNVRRLIEGCGFAVEAMDHFSLRDNPAIVVMSLAPRLYPPARRTGPQSSTPGYAALDAAMDLAFLALTWAAVPFAFVESLLGRGGTVTVEARKR